MATANALVQTRIAANARDRAVEVLVEATVAAHRMPILDSTPYDGAELRPYEGRVGALDAFGYPSLVGRRLHHPGWTTTPVG